MSNTTLIQTDLSLDEHFMELVTSALNHQGVQAPDTVEFYLVNLLSRFHKTEKCYPNTEDNGGEEEPLAIRILQAMKAEHVEKMHLLRELGDFSLFISGYFSDSLQRKIVDIDYYIAMGEKAYWELSSLSIGRSSRRTLSEVFTELATKFSQFVNVIAEVSDRCSLTGNKDILRIYERWLRTKSPRDADLLSQKGIVPNDSSCPDFIQ